MIDPKSAKIRNPDCDLCGLHRFAKTVCVPGRGLVPNDIMLIGEAPGTNEDIVGEPFAGRSGEKLDACCVEAGIHPFITNSTKCHPPKNRAPHDYESRICSQRYLVKELAVVRPGICVALGEVASSLFPERPPLNRLVETAIGGFNIGYIRTYHPGFCLPHRGGSLATTQLVEALVLARDYIRDRCKARMSKVQQANSLGQ